MQSTQITNFAAVITTALALVPGMAHLLELPNKIRMQRDDYLNAQRLYRGWQFVGIAAVAALISTFLLLLRTTEGPQFAFSLTAFLAILATQAVFWIFTFPVNRRTRNWTEAPANWEALRARWEYSHAGSAALGLLALVSATWAVLQ